MITVIMQSYLGSYATAAKDRVTKFHRAVQSVIDQTYQDWELLVIADGCTDTKTNVAQYDDERIKGYFIPKQPMWSVIPRNLMIGEAKGEYICYLDSDDYFGKYHLEHLSQFDKHGFYFFNDWIRAGENWKERKCTTELSRCGTSNILHKNDKVFWPQGGYAHDFYFIKNLEKVHGVRFVDRGFYYVCHIPNKYDI